MTDREIAQAIRRADADALRHQLEDERDVCLHHNNFVGAGEVSYIRKHVMEMSNEDAR